MSIFLGFNSNRIVTIIVGLFGIYASTRLDGEGFYAAIRYCLLAISILAIACILIIVLYEFMKYLHHYRRYNKLKNDWNDEQLRIHLKDLEDHYNKYLAKKIYFYIPYRNMTDEIKVVLERA